MFIAPLQFVQMYESYLSPDVMNYTFVLFRGFILGTVALEPVSGALGTRWESLPQTGRLFTTHTHTYRHSVQIVFWTVGGNLRTWRKPSQQWSQYNIDTSNQNELFASNLGVASPWGWPLARSKTPGGPVKHFRFSPLHHGEPFSLAVRGRVPTVTCINRARARSGSLRRDRKTVNVWAAFTVFYLFVYVSYQIRCPVSFYSRIKLHKV